MTGLVLIVISFSLFIFSLESKACYDLQKQARNPIVIQEIKAWHEHVSRENMDITIFHSFGTTPQFVLENASYPVPNWNAMGLDSNVNNIGVIGEKNEVLSWDDVAIIVFGKHAGYRFHYHVYPNTILDEREHYYSVTPEISVSCIPRD